MATRPARPTTRRRRHRTAHLEFSAIEIVGSLLTPDIVARVAAFDAPDQTEESYGVLPGLNLRDEIARYYRIGEALWSRFSQTALVNPESSSKFITTLLQQCFGFETLHQQKAVNVGDREFPLHHAALGIRVPVVIAPCVPEGHRRAGVDEGLPRFADGHRRRSATLLVQEYLNAAPEAMWGIASDGFTLRLLRDSVSLTRPSWIEANISKIFAEGLFPDFSALWLLIHESRFGQSDAQASDCSLERWRERGRTDGVAAREHLRNGVEAALLELGAGFIEHPASQTLRVALSSGSLSGQSYYEELLRLVYRFIFLFVAEDRRLLHTSKATEEARRVYADGYSLGRLRERCMRRAAWDRHTDSWEGVKAAHSALARGDERLGLPALGGLFAAGVLTNLEKARIENRRLLAAIWRLAWLRPEGQPLTRVNWRDMETEEFGSVYESLLELVPRPSADHRTFQFAEGEEGRGSERKTSGSYYTPDVLVKLLLDSVLDPILEAAEIRNPADPVAEILKLSIIDPACGSGHFLLGAARRAAGRIAKLRSPGAPSQAEFQHALREVVSQCIYGVDRNHMAVELCRVALWIEALESDKPLAFLDNHVRCGDSLIGVFSYDILRDGVPDEAYKQLTGDSKDAVKSYAQLNREGRDGKGATGLFAEFQAPQQLAAGAMAVFAMPEDSLQQVLAKAAAFDDLQVGQEWQQLNAACDSYVAAFFAPKVAVPTDEDLADGPVPLTEHVWMIVRGASLKPHMKEAVEATTRRIKAFHWPIQFPHVIARGGFDVVIGNPPWDQIQLDPREWFASRDLSISDSQHSASRDRGIDALKTSNPALFQDFCNAKHTVEAYQAFVHACGRFPTSSYGRLNTAPCFVELFNDLTLHGRAGIIVPTGIATDSFNQYLFKKILDSNRLAGLIDFENRDAIFPGVHRSYKFCLLTIGASDRADFSFFLTDTKQLEESERKFSLTSEQIARINPNTKTAPVFRSRADAQLTTKLYSKAPVLIEEHAESDGGDVNPWGISFQLMFMMNTDSTWFMTASELAADGWTREGTNWILETADGVEDAYRFMKPK